MAGCRSAGWPWLVAAMAGGRARILPPLRAGGVFAIAAISPGRRPLRLGQAGVRRLAWVPLRLALFHQQYLLLSDAVAFGHRDGELHAWANGNPVFRRRAVRHPGDIGSALVDFHPEPGGASHREMGGHSGSSFKLYACGAADRVRNFDRLAHRPGHTLSSDARIE